MKRRDACVRAVALVASDSLRPRAPQPARLLCSWGSPGKNTGVGCHAPPPRNLPDSGIEPLSSVAPTSPAGSLLLSHWGSLKRWNRCHELHCCLAKKKHSKHRFITVTRENVSGRWYGGASRKDGPCLGLGAHSPWSLRWGHDDLHILSFSFVKLSSSSLLSSLLSLL